MVEINDNSRQVNTVCTGTCAKGNLTESKIEATCKVKDGKAGWVDGKEEVLDQKKIDTTYKEECLKCKDFPDKEDKFKWNCTLQVFTPTVSAKLLSEQC